MCSPSCDVLKTHPSLFHELVQKLNGTNANFDDFQIRSFAAFATNKLSSLLERDETPQREQSLDTVVSASAHGPMMPGAFITDDSVMRTPQSASRPQADHNEMHPSKAQQSTTKEPPNSGLRLGFGDLKEGLKSTMKELEATPTKSTLTTVSTSNFEFTWNRPESDLSLEAQRMMENVREEAARIKEKMRAERDEQNRKDEEADALGNISRRKIARPKPKAGRFSDVHKEEFKKMDSIANHVSTWKNKFGSNNGKPSLKRKQSKAELDASELEPERATEPVSERLENTSPGKRMRTAAETDVSSGRPISKVPQLQAQSSIPRLGVNFSRLVSRDGRVTTIPRALPTAALTPTKSSLARAASSRDLQASKLPTISRSKSTKELRSPSTQIAEAGTRLFSPLRKVASVRSILHSPTRKFSDDPLKIAAGTHIPTPKKSHPPGRNLPSLPGTPLPSYRGTPGVKRVGFTPDTRGVLDDVTDEVTNSPSPAKIPSYPALPKPGDTPSKSPEKPVAYPTIDRSKIPGPLSSNPPGDFTFRSDKSMNFGPATAGRIAKPSVRHVRPSGISTPIDIYENLPTMPSIPHGIENKKRHRAYEGDDTPQMKPENFLTLPHGIENKKRRRLNDEDELEDMNNRAPSVINSGGERTAKRAKPSPIKKADTEEPISRGATPARRRLFGLKSPIGKSHSAKSSPVKKTTLSLSRLNMLARPKLRR